MEVLSKKKLEFIKKPADSFINPLIKKTSSKNWEKTTDYFKNEVVLKRSLINSFDSSIKFSSLKKGIKKSSKRITKELLLNYLIKPLFRLDILLSRLYFFFKLLSCQTVYTKWLCSSKR